MKASILPTTSSALTLLALAAIALTSSCTSSQKAKQIADEPVVPGQTLGFFGRGLASNPYTPKAVNRESYAPKYTDGLDFDEIYSK